MPIPERYESFEDFYPYYLSEHRQPTCRRLHFLGILLALTALLTIVLSQAFRFLWLPLVLGYGFAWVGHYFFEKNRPATFEYPLYSLRGDFRMFREILTGRRSF